MKKLLTLLLLIINGYAYSQTATLSGSGTDADGTIVSFLWTKISGPVAGTITTPSSATTTVTGLVQGIYQFELKVTDNSGSSGRDTVQVTVLAGNKLPKANAGADLIIQLPASAANLKGIGTDTDGTITAYRWTRVSGPGVATVWSPAGSSTYVNGLKAGSHLFRFKVTDNLGGISTDDMTVVVKKR